MLSTISIQLEEAVAKVRTSHRIVSLPPKNSDIGKQKNNCHLLSDKFIILKAYTLHAAIW